jgi:hypothetical protein
MADMYLECTEKIDGSNDGYCTPPPIKRKRERGISDYYVFESAYGDSPKRACPPSPTVCEHKAAAAEERVEESEEEKPITKYDLDGDVYGSTRGYLGICHLMGNRIRSDQKVIMKKARLVEKYMQRAADFEARVTTLESQLATADVLLEKAEKEESTEMGRLRQDLEKARADAVAQEQKTHHWQTVAEWAQKQSYERGVLASERAFMISLLLTNPGGLKVPTATLERLRNFSAAWKTAKPASSSSAPAPSSTQ